MKLKSFLTAVALAASSASASAAVFIDPLNFNVLIGNGGSYTYTHNILDNGFAVGGTIDGFELAVRLTDDDKDTSFFGVCVSGCESASIDPEGILNLSFTGEINGTQTYSASFASSANPVLNLLTTAYQLQQDGMLSVTVRSEGGDFILVGSTLTAQGSVPLPGTMALLGIGLVGAGALTRRKR